MSSLHPTDQPEPVRRPRALSHRALNALGWVTAAGILWVVLGTACTKVGCVFANNKTTQSGAVQVGLDVQGGWLQLYRLDIQPSGLFVVVDFAALGSPNTQIASLDVDRNGDGTPDASVAVRRLGANNAYFDTNGNSAADGTEATVDHDPGPKTLTATLPNTGDIFQGASGRFTLTFFPGVITNPSGAGTAFFDVTATSVDVGTSGADDAQPPPPKTVVAKTSARFILASCGNGTLEVGEQCDAGGESATCDTDCSVAGCGDGTTNQTALEECDDGGTVAGDGCSGTCEEEAGWTCTTHAGQTSDCTEDCVLDPAPEIPCNDVDDDCDGVDTCQKSAADTLTGTLTFVAKKPDNDTVKLKLGFLWTDHVFDPAVEGLGVSIEYDTSHAQFLIAGGAGWKKSKISKNGSVKWGFKDAKKTGSFGDPNSTESVTLSCDGKKKVCAGSISIQKVDLTPALATGLATVEFTIGDDQVSDTRIWVLNTKRSKFVATKKTDTDADGTTNDVDTDDDGDGQTDADEGACGSNPGDATSTAPDFDGDSQPDCLDPDDDNDGVGDGDDAFPLDPGESVDTDADGRGNNADPNDDGDSQTDAHETACGSDPLNAASTAPDADGDGIPDCIEVGPDADMDGILDALDIYCPHSPPAQIVNAVGCEVSVPVLGATVHCNHASTCPVTSSGGPCTDCAVAGEDGETFHCPAQTTPGSACSVGSDGTAGCIGCQFTAPGADVGCVLGARCTRVLNGPFTCASGPNGCATTAKPSGPMSSCSETTGCQTLIDHAAYTAAVGDKAIVIIKKQTTDGSGDGQFGIYGFNGFSGGRQEHALQTQGGAATVMRTTVPGPGGSPFDVAEFSAPPGWILQSIACDAPHDLIGTTGVRIRSLVPLDPVTCTFINHKIPPGEILVRLLAALVAPEGAFRSRTFGLPPGNRISIAGNNGFIVIDALTDQTPTVGNAFLSFTSLGESRAVGALVVEHPLGNGSDGIFAYGTNATTRQYFPADQNFGFIAIGPFGNLTDGVHFGGDPAAPGVLWVNHSAGSGGSVGAQVWRDFGGGQLTLSGSSVTTLGSGSTFPGASGRIISAFAFDTLEFGTDGLLSPNSTGWVAAVTIGQPGELWLKDPATFANGTKIGSVGNDPRRIRCLPSANRCIVSNFGSDSLTIVQWGGLGSATILGTVPVGDGPVGIDLRADGADVAVISTGLNDHTYTVTKIAPDGSVPSNVTEAAPTGCTNPGHGLWLDGVSSTIVVTCNGSNAYAVITP